MRNEGKQGGDQQNREPAKKDAGDSEKRAKDLKPHKEKGKDVKGGGFRLK